MQTVARVQEVIKSLQEKTKLKITRDNIILQSLFTQGGTLTDRDSEIIDRQIRQLELQQQIKKQFAHLSNKDLINRINGLPDFKWDDEGAELQRRIEASAGKFAAQMQGNKIVILKDE